MREFASMRENSAVSGASDRMADGVVLLCWLCESC